MKLNIFFQSDFSCINLVGTLMKHIWMDSLDIFIYKSTKKNHLEASGKWQLAKVGSIVVGGK